MNTSDDDFVCCDDKFIPDLTTAGIPLFAMGLISIRVISASVENTSNSGRKGLILPLPTLMRMKMTKKIANCELV